MKINVPQIRQAIGERQSFRFLCPVSKFDGHESFWLSGTLEVQGEAYDSGLGISVAGTIFGSAKCVCNRCLKDFDLAVKIPLSENYQNADMAQATAEEADYAMFEGDEIDLTDLVRETLILAEPLKLLCSGTCKGLCSKCGADLNITPCSCEQDDIDPRLAALKKLLSDNN